VEQYGSTRQVTDDNMTHVMCRIPKATDAYSEYVILISFPHEQWSRERLSVLLYAYIACIVNPLAPELFFLILAHPVYKM